MHCAGVTRTGGRATRVCKVPGCALAAPAGLGQHRNERTGQEAHPPRISCVLMCGGVWRDMDVARLELLKLPAEDARVPTCVFEDFESIAAIKAADLFIT